MKPYSMDLRERVVAACDAREGTREQIAKRFGVSDRWIRRLLARRKETGSFAAFPQNPGRKPKLNERQVVLRMNLITNLQPAKQVVPTVAAFDHPPASLEPRVPLSLPFFLATTLDVRDVPAPRGRVTQFGVVVSFVAAQMLVRLLLGRRSPNHDGVQRVIELLHVVPVRAGKCDRQGDAVGVREGVPFGAQFAAIRRVWSRLIPPLTGADTVALSRDWKRQSIPWRSS